METFFAVLGGSCLALLAVSTVLLLILSMWRPRP